MLVCMAKFIVTRSRRTVQTQTIEANSAETALNTANLRRHDWNGTIGDEGWRYDITQEG